MQIGDGPPKWAQLPLNWLKGSTEQPQYPHCARTASDTPPYTHVGTINEKCEAYKCSTWKPFLRSYTMRNNCTCSPLEDAFG